MVCIVNVYYIISYDKLSISSDTLNYMNINISV